MLNLIKERGGEVGFLWGEEEGTPTRVTRTQNLPSKDRVNIRKWLISNMYCLKSNMLKHTRNTSNSGIRLYKKIYNE